MRFHKDSKFTYYVIIIHIYQREDTTPAPVLDPV